MKAQAISAIPILASHNLGGDQVIETTCRDYDHYCRLPEAVNYRGTVYGLTGWNSDTARACYKSSARIAYPL